MPIDKIVSVIDRDTGEVLSSTVRTEEQAVGWSKHLAAERGKEAKQHYFRKQETELGNFIWLLYNVHEALNLGLRQAEFTRLIYLSTYINRDNYIVLPNGYHVKGRDLGKLLKLGKSAANQFYNSALECGILVEELHTKFLKLSSEVFAKGKLCEVIGDSNAMRLYIGGVRHLYEKSSPREHRFLYYVFQAIPYVNIQMNILCQDQYALTIAKSIPLSLGDYGELIGYDTHNLDRLEDALSSIRVFGEVVFGFMRTGDTKYIVINPRLFYAGSEYERVRHMGEYFGAEKEIHDLNTTDIKRGDDNN